MINEHELLLAVLLTIAQLVVAQIFADLLARQAVLFGAMLNEQTQQLIEQLQHDVIREDRRVLVLVTVVQLR